MIGQASGEAARRWRVRSASRQGGAGLWHTTYLGTNHTVRGREGRSAEDDRIPEEPGEVYAMAFLIEQDANCQFHAHFHKANQFQVVVAGNGWIGSHPLGCLSVHYANAYTAYGPIVSGHAGLHYFTLRNGWDPGPNHMPGARAELLAAGRTPREVFGKPVNLRAPGQRTLGVGAGREELIAPQGDGLEAQLYRLKPGESVRGGAPADGGGQYWVSLAGSMRRGEEELPEMSCVFVSPDEAPVEVTAGAEGAEILVTQFPRSAVAEARE